MVGDHDFTKLLLTPSVILNVNIPEEVENSILQGQGICWPKGSHV